MIHDEKYLAGHVSPALAFPLADPKKETVKIKLMPVPTKPEVLIGVCDATQGVFRTIFNLVHTGELRFASVEKVKALIELRQLIRSADQLIEKIGGAR